MRARVTNTFGYGGKLDAFVEHLQQEVIPAEEREHGYRGMLVLGDHRTDHLILITLWERGRDERTSGHGAEFERRLRAAMPFIGMRMTHEAFDVLLATWPEDRAPNGPPFDAAGGHAVPAHDQEKAQAWPCLVAGLTPEAIRCSLFRSIALVRRGGNVPQIADAGTIEKSTEEEIIISRACSS